MHQSIEELELDLDDATEAEEALHEELSQLRSYARSVGRYGRFY
jgi:hypothetical protein